MANKVDITGVKGSDLNLSLTALNSAGSSINLSGQNIRGYVRFQFGSTGTLLNLTPTIHSGSAGEAFVSGIVNVFVSGHQLTGVPVTRGRYDIEIYTNNHVTGIFNGKFSMLPEVTY